MDNKQDRSCEDEKNQSFKESSCLKVRRLVFPIEIFMCLLLFLVMSSSEIYKQYIFQTIARQTLANFSSNSSFHESVCLKQDSIVNQTGDNATFQNIQKTANTISMYCEVISLVSSAVMALFYGPLSDIIGRKPVLTLCLVGAVLSSIVQVIVIEMNTNIYWLLLSMGVFGILGGASTILGVSFASVTDITSKKWRSVRLSTTESALGFGKASSYLIVFNWINNNGCNFRGPAYLMVGSSAIAFIYMTFMPESLRQDSHQTKKSHGFHKIINGAKIFWLPGYLGVSKWWRICVCVLIITIGCLCLIGSLQIMNFFLHNKPLEWSYHMIGYYGLISSASTVLALVLILPLLVVIFRFSNQVICLISITMAIIANIMTATVKTSWEMFLITGFQGLQQMAFPALRAMISEFVNPEDYGSVLAITASIQMFASAGSTVLYNEVYHPQAFVKGHHVNAGMVFWITAGFWAVTIPLLFLLFIKIRKESNKESQHLVEDKQKYHSINS